MKNRVELRAYIRYLLSQLSERNAEHEFESLAFELARSRHVSNLQPATGSVKAGGDQGRDFESYHTYLRSSTIGRTTFSTLISQDLVVGACSIDKKIVPKIRADLKTIFGTGERPDRVIYYCEKSIPVAKRHELQDECRNTYGAKLDIYDGLAIADMLSDADTFWIAEHHLNVPANFFPEGEVDEEYEKLRQRWLSRGRVPSNYADFNSIKSGLRTAVTEDAARPHFLEWLARMELFLREAYSPLTRHRARYEIASAEFKRGTLDRAMSALTAYFEEVAEFTRHPSDLLDASVLVGFAFRAMYEKQSGLTIEQIISWRDVVSDLIEETLKTAAKRVDRLALMEAQALIRPYDFDRPMAEKQKSMVVAWLEIVRLARSVPYYPLPHLDQMLKLVSEFASGMPEFTELREECEAIMRERSGARTISDKAFQRASGHYRAGKLLAAIDELHRAKVGAFTGEEVPQAVLLMLMLSECYSELKLHFAARYYAAGALYLSANASEEAVYQMLPQTAFALARAHYQAGEGVSALLLCNLAMHAQAHLVPDPGDTEQHDDLQSTMADVALTFALAKRFVPEVLPVLENSINGWPFERRIVDQYLAVAQSAKSPWSTMPYAEVEDRCEEQLGVLPFQDLGTRRTVRWMALGIQWTVVFTSDPKTLSIVYGFLATLQVVQAEFASADLNVIPAKVTIQVDVAARPQMSIAPGHDNDELRWRVTLPSQRTETATPEASTVDVLSIVVTIIGQATALKADAFSERIEDLFKRGLPNRVFSVRPTEELMGFVLEQMDGGEKLSSITPPATTRVLQSMTPAELAWKGGLGPGYTAAKAKQVLENRYKNSKLAIRLSLPRILEDPRGQAWILKCRESGLLDWCILNMLANVVCAYQIEQSTGRALDPRNAEAFLARFRRPEEEADAVFDLSTLNDDLFDAQYRVMLIAVANTWGLVSNVQTPVFAGFRRLLEERYGFASDDIPHDDPFPGVPE